MQEKFIQGFQQKPDLNQPDKNRAKNYESGADEKYRTMKPASSRKYYN